MAIVKIIDKGQKMPMVLKLKFIRNKSTLDITNKPQIYQKRRRGQNRQNIGQNINWRRNRLFSRERNYNSNRGYG